MYNNEQMVAELNKLVQVNLDREAGYQKASEAVEDTGLKTFFQDCRGQSASYLATLNDIIRNHGGEPEKETSTTGDLYRIWMDIKSALALSNAKAVLQSCEAGEDVALNSYENVLQSNGFADRTVMQEIELQKEGIKTMHDRVKLMRDSQP